MTPIAILATLALALAVSIPANTALPVPGSGQGPLPGTTVPSRKVLIIGIDGLRSDAFRKADTPHLNGLKKSGALAERAVTDVRARSGPGWTSILTGVWSWKHGARDNAFQGYRPDLHPTFLDRIAMARPGAVVGAVVNWKPIGSNLFGRHGFWVAPGDDKAVAEEASRLIGQGTPDVLFVHFDGVDHAGHTYGFSPNMPFYMWAVEKIDGYVGRLIEAVRGRPDEEWLILVTSDHGGTYRHHGANTPEDRTVFLLTHGAGCRPERPSGFRGVVDVAPTAFAFLGIPVPAEWKWDGKPLGYDPAPASDRPVVTLIGRQQP